MTWLLAVRLRPHWGSRDCCLDEELRPTEKLENFQSELLLVKNLSDWMEDKCLDHLHLEEVNVPPAFKYRYLP